MTASKKTDFTSLAENKAQEAQSLRAFRALNLLNIRSTTAELLAHIGKHGIFEQYTIHDISHIDKMLGMLEWLIPDDTKRVMTPADWLMVVLGVYFHDLGMVITRREFDSRDASGFKEFRRAAYSGEQGEDYQAKIAKFGSVDEKERFLYQEFVRSHHARRIKLWIMGQSSVEFGISEDAAREVRDLVKPLGERFCRDLALVCESHHLEDLRDLKKYKPNQAYGDDVLETANLQYSAILLRAADLLHVTQDRTPSIAFLLISPTDPISVEEWHKQMAVVAVRSKVAKDKEGNANQSLPRDTVVIDAYFEHPAGFFALSKYLQYVQKELKQCHDWANLGFKETGVNYEFPWRYLDESNIETHGFINKQFEFTLDQAKILDLLTGHTLYNDIKVVLRELVQNSIDAVRVNSIETGAQGSIHVKWDSGTRTLSVEDTGTGMSQGIIEEHLLKVGSSRYQDPEFQKKHPDFNPISRFGIGVLSTFMIADEVEVITSHSDNEHARQLSLRSVHGRYLVKLLNKGDLPEPLKSSSHGTIIKLSVRPSVRMPDILDTTRLWVVFPPCDVFVSTDEKPATKVGFGTPREAVEAYYHGLLYHQHDKVTFKQTEFDGVTVAYALYWNDFFREWSFVVPHFPEENREPPPLGLCVEGIRVTFGTPGFEGHPILAIANAAGQNAPKTNVARSGLEFTSQRERALSAIYRALSQHVTTEITELASSRGFSLTWAAQEAEFLIRPLSSGRESRPDDTSLLTKELAEIPSLIVEENGQRRSTTPEALNSSQKFWTVDCAFFDSAENMLREVPGSISLSALSTTLLGGKLYLQPGTILCGFDPDRTLDGIATRRLEVSEVSVDTAQRRVDILWSARGAEARWTTLGRWLIERGRPESEHFYRGLKDISPYRVYVGLRAITLNGGAEEVTAVKAFRRAYILYRSPLARCIKHYLESGLSPESVSAVMSLALFLFDVFAGTTRAGRVVREQAEEIVKEGPRYGTVQRSGLEGLDLAPLYSMCEEEKWVVFDRSEWLRKA